MISPPHRIIGNKIMKANRYKYIEHSIIPSELVGIEHQIKSLNRWDKERVDGCGYYLKSSLSKGSLRHHFYYDKKMGVKMIIEIQPIRKWSSNPSKYFIFRKYRGSKEINRSDTNNGYKVELSELYFCRNCEVYCWSHNRIVMDENVLWNFSMIKI